MKIADYVNALPDAYQKHSESNNYKLLSLEQKPLEEFRADIEAVQATLDIYNASGETLDLYGEMYGVSRGVAIDEQYRYLILQKVAQNMVNGDYNSIVTAISVAFGVPASSFSFRETDNPAEVEAMSLPFSIMQNAGLTAEQMTGIIQRLLPAGVHLAPMNLEGTFEFSAIADEYDESSGFGNVDQTIGGYLGYLAS